MWAIGSEAIRAMFLRSIKWEVQSMDGLMLIRIKHRDRNRVQRKSPNLDPADLIYQPLGNCEAPAVA
jgi:hypothetical protein